MPIAVFSDGEAPRLGRVIGDILVDISRAAPDLPRTIRRLLAAGPEAMARAAALGADDGPIARIEDVRLHAPLPDPQKYLAIGLNYADHSAESEKLGFEPPKYQTWFNKQVSCIAGPFDDIIYPAVSNQLDYEAELAVVIGRRCRAVPKERAHEVIGGFMVANDVSARDWQFRTRTTTLGKSFDTHGPTGPWLTLPGEIEDPHNLGLRTFVNGERRQDGNTRDLIFDIYDKVSYLSKVMTLMPGDILATGTPAGVGIASDPPRLLSVGDVVRIEIDGLGYIENRIAAEIGTAEKD